jgi:hypothetical protein
VRVELKRIPKINTWIFETTILFIFECSSTLYKCLFVWLLLVPEQFFSSPAAVIITGGRAANLDLYAYCSWVLAVWVLFCAKPTSTRDLGVYDLIWRTVTHIPQWDSKYSFDNKTIRLKEIYCSTVQISFKLYTYLTYVM